MFVRQVHANGSVIVVCDITHVLVVIFTGHLTIQDMRVVQTVLWDARPKWYNIGIQLHITVSDLDVIKEKNLGNPDECFTELLTQWLRQVNPPPTWISMMTALRSPTVNLSAVAETVEREYGLNLESVLKNTPQAATVQNEASQENVDVATNHKYQHIREFQGLSDEQKDQLEMRLEMESQNIQLKFLTLRSKFFDSLDAQQHPIKKLVRQLKCLKVLKKEITPQSSSTVQSYEHTIDKINDIEDIKDIIEEQSTFFDFRIVEYMIENVGQNSDTKLLEEYKANFEHYIKRRMFECPTDIIPTHAPKDCCELLVKLEHNYDKLVELKQFQCRLSFILNISIHVLRLSSVREGCIQLCFLIPKFIQEAIFPLSKECLDKLKELGVIELSCGNHHYFPPGKQVYFS